MKVFGMYVEWKGEGWGKWATAVAASLAGTYLAESEMMGRCVVWAHGQGCAPERAPECAPVHASGTASAQAHWQAWALVQVWERGGDGR